MNQCGWDSVMCLELSVGQLSFKCVSCASQMNEMERIEKKAKSKFRIFFLLILIPQMYLVGGSLTRLRSLRTFYLAG